MRIAFTKMVASGNDFVVIDCRGGKSSPKVKWPDFAREVSERRFGIGSDGLLVLEDSKDCEAKMRIFNPDGSEVSMCGNGARCIALFLREAGANKAVKIETPAGGVEAEVLDNRVKMRMPDPKDFELNFELEVGGKTMKANFVDTGVPHVVYFVDDVDTFDVVGVGKGTRYHQKFKPEGTNANFVRLKKDSIEIRTYERGVEDETLACGTGSVASSLISAKLHKLNSPIKVATRSGEMLTVHFDRNGNNFSNIHLEGSARVVYKGEVNYGI